MVQEAVLTLGIETQFESKKEPTEEEEVKLRFGIGTLRESEEERNIVLQNRYEFSKGEIHKIFRSCGYRVKERPIAIYNKSNYRNYDEIVNRKIINEERIKNQLRRKIKLFKDTPFKITIFNLQLNINEEYKYDNSKSESERFSYNFKFIIEKVKEVIDPLPYLELFLALSCSGNNIEIRINPVSGVA